MNVRDLLTALLQYGADMMQKLPLDATYCSYTCHACISVHAVMFSCLSDSCVLACAGLPKHHICNANLMKNGADFAVYISTAQEFDGSDSGARPDEAVSWGKIRADAQPVKVYGDASILFPLIISQTFAKQIIPASMQGKSGC